MGQRVWRIGIVVLLGITGLIPVTTPTTAGSRTEDFIFGRWWGRWDLPVKDGTAARTWIWGPRFDADWENNWGNLPIPNAERYDDEFRPVMYLDKARMEIPDLDAAADDRPEDNLWLVTTGLLATELITGQLQLGDTSFEQHDPAQIPVAGDLESTLTPTYADLRQLLGENPIPANKAVNQTLVPMERPVLTHDTPTSG